MSKSESSRRAVLQVSALVVALLGAGVFLASVVIGGAEAAPPVQSAGATDTPVVETVPDGQALSTTALSPPPGCHPKKCKGRPWCECTYTFEGREIPRVSCDPCCYDDESLQFPICLD